MLLAFTGRLIASFAGAALYLFVAVRGRSLVAGAAFVFYVALSVSTFHRAVAMREIPELIRAADLVAISALALIPALMRRWAIVLSPLIWLGLYSFEPPWTVLSVSGLIPAVVMLRELYRRNAISSRLAFAFQMGFVLALYLLLVRWLAAFAEEHLDAFGPLVEAALIFAAAMAWLPLYGWMTRFLSKRAALYAEFSRRIIEDAAAILDLPQRIAFLEAQVAKTFGVERARIAMGDGSQDGFQYRFPLRYQDRPIGTLLIDTGERALLDEDRTALTVLSGQIAHSIATGRIVEEKIRLEHLATVGRAAATLAHEVKNPLSSIKTLTQLLREDPEVRERYEQDLGFILSEVDRLNGTMQQLLSYSRSAAPVEEEVDVSGLLETISTALAREQEGKVRIERRIAPGLALQRASSQALQQIVWNLLINAVQASPSQGTVTVEAHSGEISITDEGPGISSEVRGRIFEPFFTTKQKGTGLGLAIVQKNVREMGGEIAIESPVANGRGTRVRILLPW